MSDLLKTENVTITLMPDGGHITAIHNCDATDDMEEFIVQQSIANKILRTRLDGLEAEALQYYEFAAYDTDTIKDQASEIKSLQSQLEEAKRINAEKSGQIKRLEAEVLKCDELSAYDTDTVKDQASEIKSYRSAIADIISLVKSAAILVNHSSPNVLNTAKVINGAESLVAKEYADSLRNTAKGEEG